MMVHPRCGNTKWIFVTLLLCLITFAQAGNRLSQIKMIEDYTNLCLIGKYHKSTPGEEKFLHNECSRYQDRSCCHANTTLSMYATNRWHGLTVDHCPDHSMGAQCRRMFMAELCFYECSPNTGPWLVEVDQKIRQERPFGMPMCQRQCDVWWRTCKAEYTCVTNWGRSFSWRNGHNVCPNGSVCQTFEEKYQTANNFCQTVWDGGWHVVEDSQACFRFDFDPNDGNPNDAVALERAKEILSVSSSSPYSPSGAFVSLSFAFSFWLWSLS